DRADLGARDLEGALGRIPVGDVAFRGIYLETLPAHVGEPAVLARRARAATGDHRVAVPVQTAADRRADATHAPRDVRDALRFRFHNIPQGAFAESPITTPIRPGRPRRPKTRPFSCGRKFRAHLRAAQGLLPPVRRRARVPALPRNAPQAIAARRATTSPRRAEHSS